ncbi:MAG: phage tail tape measure protein [Methanobrevibacter sp.]|nr:phage tail tape measure protein [Methanobrevibacter sp.]
MIGLNEVSNNFAISSGQLSDSLTKSSAVLANAGVTFEEQLALITAGTEVIRNANTVSTRT